MSLRHNFTFECFCILFFIITTEAVEHHKLLLVSFDGFRYDLADQKPILPGFQYLNTNGVRAKYLQPAFPTLTIPTHMTIATGLHPESHNAVHNCYYNISSGVVDPKSEYFSSLTQNYWWDSGAEPIWITAVNQGLKSGGYMYPGSYNTFNGVSPTKKYIQNEFISTFENTWPESVNAVIRWLTEDDLDFVALHFLEPDFLLHKNGPTKNTKKDVSVWVSNTILDLISKVDKAGLTDNLNIIFVSDHGHLPINTSIGENEAISLNKHVRDDDVDFQLCYGPIGLIQPKLGRKEEVYRALKQQPNIDVYYKEDLPERWHLKKSDRITSIFVLGHPGFFVYWNYPGFHVTKGDHGYDNTLPNMRAFYYSIGPSFKKNYVMDGFESVHIYSLMCHLLGLKPAPNNGTLDVLRHTLKPVPADYFSLNMPLLVIVVLVGLYVLYNRFTRPKEVKFKGV
uniref:AP3A hydrolase n=1 Tax=Ciona savignyi TaxID=51511 RepID=H2Z124_CIOSA